MIKEKINEIEMLQQRMSKFITAIQSRQYSLKNEIFEMLIDDEADGIINTQWDPKNLKKINKIYK